MNGRSIKGCLRRLRFQRQVDPIIENNEIYKRAIINTILEVDVQVAETLDTVEKAKVFMKWTLPLHRQLKNYYIINLIMRRRLRIMNQKMAMARNLLKKIRQSPSS